MQSFEDSSSTSADIKCVCRCFALVFYVPQKSLLAETFVFGESTVHDAAVNVTGRKKGGGFLSSSYLSCVMMILSSIINCTIQHIVVV